MKSLSSVLVALAAAGFLPVCSAEAQTIALFTKNNTNPFSQAIRVGSNAAAMTLGVKVVHYVPTTPDNVAEQAKLVEDAIRNTPDAIVFDPVDNEKLVSAIEKINAANIPVVEVTDRSTGGKFVSRVLPDDYQIALAVALDRDRGARKRIFRGIVEQVEQHLFEQYGIQLQHRQVGRDIKLNVVPLQDLARAPERTADDLADVVQCRVRNDGAGFKLGHVEQVGNEAIEALGLIDHGCQQIVLLLVAQSAGEIAHGRGRAEDRG